MEDKKETGETTRTRTITWDEPRNAVAHRQDLSGLEYMQKMIEGELPRPPISHVLNFALTEVSEGRAVFFCEPDEYHYNPLGRVHGGLAATLLDSAMGCAVHTTLPAGVGYTTIELKVNFIRAISKDTGRLRCEANVIHIGGRTATADAKLIDEQGKLYAHGTTTCIIFRP
jgi:uncharacterized protein (TIGR00369 family)